MKRTAIARRSHRPPRHRPPPSSSPASSSSPPAAGRGRAEGKRLTLGGGEPSDNPETTPLFDTYADDGRVFGDADLILPLDISPHASPVLDAPGYSFDVGKGVTRWPAFLSTSWEFDENLAMAKGAMAPLLAAPWRLMLLSDGSVTRHLQLLTDAKVTVDVLSHDAVRLADIERDSSVPADVFRTLASFTPATGNHPEGNTNNVNTDANGATTAPTRTCCTGRWTCATAETARRWCTRVRGGPSTRLSGSVSLYFNSRVGN